MIGKCKAIAHGSNALEYIFREGKLDKALLFHNLCGTTPKDIYGEMKIGQRLQHTVQKQVPVYRNRHCTTR